MKSVILIITFIVLLYSCSIERVSPIPANTNSTLTELLEMKNHRGAGLSRSKSDFHSVIEESGFILHSYRKKKDSEAYLIIKLNNKGNFVSAVYYPFLEQIELKKEDIFKMFETQDWKRKTENVAHDDMTQKVYYLSKKENVLFGFYEIDQRKVHFVSIGSEYECETIVDMFLF